MPYRIRCTRHDVYVTDRGTLSPFPSSAQVFTSSGDAETARDDFAKTLGPSSLFDFQVQYFLAGKEKRE